MTNEGRSKPRVFSPGDKAASFLADNCRVEGSMGGGYRSNRNVVYSCKYHVVFCPKYRRRVLVDGVDVRLKEIIREVAAEHGVDVIEVEVMPDHVHLLAEVDPQFGVSRFVRLVKGRSSRLLRGEFPRLRMLPVLWTNSYFVATVGGAPLAVLREYIENQKYA